MKFWDFPEELRWELLSALLGNRGEVIAEDAGTFGKIFTLDQGPAHGAARYLIAKTPSIRSDLARAEFQEKMRRFLHEINETFKYSNHPLISRHFEVKLCAGIPFILSRKRDYTLRDYLENGQVPLVEAVCLTAQIAHVLEYCAARGLTSHQDLKPENILLEDLRRKFVGAETYPFQHRVLICDFGNANAFSAFGVACGSRPYMAPEQYSPNQNSLSKADVFATGVILHELVTDGLHPVGERTHDVWPLALPEKGKKWAHEAVWKKWANSEKTPSPTISEPIARAINTSLVADISRRHTASSLKRDLLAWLQVESPHAWTTLNVLLEHFDNLAREDEYHGWPYYEELLEQINNVEW